MEGPGGPESTPEGFRSAKVSVFALQKRSGTDFGNSGRGGDFCENAETRPDAKNGKNGPTKGPSRYTAGGFGGLADAGGEVRRGTLRVRQDPGWIPQGSRTMPSTCKGYGEFKPLREIAVSQGNPGE